MKTISIVIPCYNEAGNLFALYDRLSAVFEQPALKQFQFKLLLVNDGSQDDTLEEIKLLQRKHPRINYISFSKNFGHQNAIKAGIDHADGDALITIDADLQHPPEMIPDLLQHWQQGYDVVNTKRKDSKNQSWLKRKSSLWFYRLLNFFSYVNIEPGTADFRLIDRKVIDELKNWQEQNLFFRGIIPWLGFKQKTIDYSPDKRNSGVTKYTFRKMMSLAINGITSFSIKPLRVAVIIGLVLALLSLIYLFYAVYISLFTNQAVQGWTSVIVSVLFIGGLQMFMLGIIGEYLGKLFIENKKRPNYIIDYKSIDYEK